jgi:hypothetical protein
LCFAIEADGEVFVKTDALSRADFSAADSAPFTYVAKVLLELAGDRSRRGRRAAPVGADGTGRGAARGCRPGEAEG